MESTTMRSLTCVESLGKALAEAWLPAPWAPRSDGIGAQDMTPYLDFKRAHPEAVIFFRASARFYLVGDDALRADRLVGFHVERATNGLAVVEVHESCLQRVAGELLEAGADVGVVDFRERRADGLGEVVAQTAIHRARQNAAREAPARKLKRADAQRGVGGAA